MIKNLESLETKLSTTNSSSSLVEKIQTVEKCNDILLKDMLSTRDFLWLKTHELHKLRLMLESLAKADGVGEIYKPLIIAGYSESFDVVSGACDELIVRSR